MFQCDGRRSLTVLSGGQVAFLNPSAGGAEPAPRVSRRTSCAAQRCAVGRIGRLWQGNRRAERTRTASGRQQVMTAGLFVECAFRDDSCGGGGGLRMAVGRFANQEGGQMSRNLRITAGHDGVHVEGYDHVREAAIDGAVCGLRSDYVLAASLGRLGCRSGVNGANRGRTNDGSPKSFVAAYVLRRSSFVPVTPRLPAVRRRACRPARRGPFSHPRPRLEPLKITS